MPLRGIRTFFALFLQRAVRLAFVTSETIHHSLTMNTVKLNLFDTVIFSDPAAIADAFPAGTIRPAHARTQQPAPLWRQSLAAMDNAATGRAHRATQACIALLGTLTAGSVVIAAGTLIRCLGSHDGLHTAVQTLMSR